MGSLPAAWPSSAASFFSCSCSSTLPPPPPPLPLQITYDPFLNEFAPPPGAADLPHHMQYYHLQQLLAAAAAAPSPQEVCAGALPAPDAVAAAAVLDLYEEHGDDDDQEPPSGGQEIVDPLPMGYRFCPTDRVLVLEFLLNKVLRRPTPADIILDIGDIYKFDADQLPRVFRYPVKSECYFYTKRTRKYPNGSRPSRSTPSGYWKATGRDTDVVKSKAHGVVGTRKSLVFYFGRSPAPGQKTNWLMQEYRISSINEKLPQDQHYCRETTYADVPKWDDRYVLCKVYKKDEPRSERSRSIEPWADEGDAYAHNPVFPGQERDAHQF